MLLKSKDPHKAVISSNTGLSLLDPAFPVQHPRTIFIQYIIYYIYSIYITPGE